MIAMSLPALADEPYHPGTWVCERGGVCVNPQSLQRRGPTVEAHAVIPYRGKNYLGTLVPRLYEHAGYDTRRT